MSLLASTHTYLKLVWLLFEDADVFEKRVHTESKTMFDVLLKSKIRHQSVLTANPFLSPTILSQGFTDGSDVCLSDQGTLISSTQNRETTVFVHSLYWKFFTCESSEPAQPQL